MSNEKKKDNVVGIGHNQNDYSKDQYAKLLSALHRTHLYAQQEMSRVRRLFDEAFTKYPFSNPHENKLKDFEIHERRSDAETIARKFYDYADDRIDAIEKKAKADSIKLEEPTKEEISASEEDSND